MKAAILEEAHNKVVWEAKSALVWMQIGILIGGACVAAFLILVPSPLRWTLVGVTAALTIAVIIALALTTPLADHGEFERTLDGGTLYRGKQWQLFGKHLVMEAPLAEIIDFQPETRTFEETTGQTYTLTRLLVVPVEGDPAPITDWLDAEFIESLTAALARAGRIDAGED